jgi:hypothetical protein
MNGGADFSEARYYLIRPVAAALVFSDDNVKNICDTMGLTQLYNRLYACYWARQPRE